MYSKPVHCGFKVVKFAGNLQCVAEKCEAVTQSRAPFGCLEITLTSFFQNNPDWFDPSIRLSGVQPRYSVDPTVHSPHSKGSVSWQQLGGRVLLLVGFPLTEGDRPWLSMCPVIWPVVTLQVWKSHLFLCSTGLCRVFCARRVALTACCPSGSGLDLSSKCPVWVNSV